MKKKIGDVEYNIIPIPPYMSPFATKISQLVKQQPTSFEEAETASAEIKKCMDKMFSELVTPTPEKAHATQVFNALCDVTNEIAEDAGLFRRTKRSDAGKSRAAGSDTSQTPK